MIVTVLLHYLKLELLFSCRTLLLITCMSLYKGSLEGNSTHESQHTMDNVKRLSSCDGINRKPLKIGCVYKGAF